MLKALAGFALGFGTACWFLDPFAARSSVEIKWVPRQKVNAVHTPRAPEPFKTESIEFPIG